jgi:PIN domain nuclease of toxin-antitoxin system
VQVLLDTHVLYWWLTDPAKLSEKAFDEITDTRNTVLISAATALELATKTNLRKLNALPIVLNLGQYLEEEGFSEAPVTVDQGTRAGLLPMHHRDPFDRILVAQAESRGIAIISADTMLDSYDVKRLW